MATGAGGGMPGAAAAWTTYPFRVRARPVWLRNALIAAGAVAAFSAVLAASIAHAASTPLLLLVPPGLLVGGLAGWLLAAACAGSPTAIMLYFAAVIFISDGQFRVRGAGNIDADWQSALKFAMWLGAGLIGSTHMLPLQRLLARPLPALWTAYIAMSLVSSIYSPIPAYSFGCALALLCYFMFVQAVLTRLSEAQILWTLALSLTAFHVGSWIVFLAYPALGTSFAWTENGIFFRMCGLAGQAVNLGTVSAKYVGAAFLLWWTGRCRLPLALALGIFGAATLVESDTRSMIFGTILGVGAVLVSRSSWLLAAGTLACLGPLAVSMFIPHAFDGLGTHFSRSGDASEISTLNGRGEIWAFTWQQFLERPLLGWGYNSSKAVLGQHLGFENGLMVDSAHNLILQSLLSVGAVGTVPLVAIVVILCARLLARPAPILAFYAAIVLTSSIADTAAVGTTPTLLTLIFLLISLWPTDTEAAAPHPAWRDAGLAWATPLPDRQGPR